MRLLFKHLYIHHLKEVTPPDRKPAFNATTVKGGKVIIDNVTVLTTDVMGSNGVIHVIDTVVIPAT